MPVSSKQAAVDRLHEKTFRGWVNKYLRFRKPPVSLSSLAEDLRSGVHLLALVELLTRKAVRQRTYPKPSIDIHKIENVSIALAHLKSTVEKEGGNREVFDLEPVDIVAGKQKIILGMVWQMILRFQSFGAGEDLSQVGMNKGEITLEAAKAKTTQWWSEQLPSHEFSTVASIVGDGSAILELVARVVGDESIAAPAHDESLDARGRLAAAFAAAEKHLGVLQLLDPEDLLAEDPALRPDDQCLLTYVSEFPAAVKAIHENVDQEKEFASAVEVLLAEHAAAAEATEAEVDKLREEQEALAARRTEELAALEEARVAKLAELESATAAEREAALAELAAEAEAAAAAHASATEDLLRRTKEAEEELLARQATIASQADEEKQALAAERQQALDADAAERAAMEEAKAEELARLRKEAAERMKRKQEEQERQREEDANRAKMSAAQFEEWKKRQLSQLARATAEREALEQVSFEELRRLREENERLRRGTPHTLEKKRFGMGASCGLCSSSLFGSAGFICSKCSYVLCSKCMRRAPPNNCIADVSAGSGAAFDETLVGEYGKEVLEAATVVLDSTKADGLLIRTPYSANEDWKKHRRVAILSSGNLAYFSDNNKLKGLVSLADVELAESMGDKFGKAKEGAFGLVADDKALWLYTPKDDVRAAWIKAIKHEMANAKSADSTELIVAGNDKVIVKVFSAADKNTSWTLALPIEATSDEALAAWARKTNNEIDQYELLERDQVTLTDKRVNPTQPLSDLITIRSAAGSKFQFVIKLKV
mmetsp:Transcript_88/g.245  ORF Transcript_88/g.245 Transcript_88/m.245 type:complete len:775 (-) Transcript_88:45-2369(-)